MTSQANTSTPPPGSAWTPILTGSRAKRATEIALEVASRCFTPTIMTKSKPGFNSRTAPPDVRWSPSSTAGGSSGLAILATYLFICFQQQEMQLKAKHYLTEAVRWCERRSPNASFFTGSTGLAFAILYASDRGKHYKSLRNHLDIYIDVQMQVFLERALHTTEIQLTDFDLMYGAVGYAAYLLSRWKLDPSRGAETCANIVRYLIRSVKPDASNRYFFIKPHCIKFPARLTEFPDGYTDYGMAHGISGVIAVLSLAILYGWEEAGLADALRTLTDWLISHHFEDKYGFNWLAMASPEQLKNPGIAGNSRLAWCYGIPGVAMGLFLAGSALRNDDYLRIAVTALESILQRPRETWAIRSAGFCHGLNGILQATLRIYNATHSPTLRQLAINLVDELIDRYDANSLFGYREVKPKGRLSDNPELLNGAAGAALSLLAASQSAVPEWDHFLLMS